MSEAWTIALVVLPTLPSSCSTIPHVFLPFILLHAFTTLLARLVLPRPHCMLCCSSANAG